MCRQRALRLLPAQPIARYWIGVICAAKGHCDLLPLLPHVLLFEIGVICAAKGHCDILHSQLFLYPTIGVICAAKGHCDFLQQLNDRGQL